MLHLEAVSVLVIKNFLNQACVGNRPVHAWFPKIAFVCEVGSMCVCVCPPPRLLISSGMIWTIYDWLNKFYSFYMATVVIIDSRCVVETNPISIN